MTTDFDVRTASFEELEARYKHLIERHSYSFHPGPSFDVDDFRQECREVLWRAQQHFCNPHYTRFAQDAPLTRLDRWFAGYVNRAMWNRVRKKAGPLMRGKKRVPAGQLAPLDDAMGIFTVDIAEETTDRVIWLTGLSPVALRLAELIIVGIRPRELKDASGFTPAVFERGMLELQNRAETLARGKDPDSPTTVVSEGQLR